MSQTTDEERLNGLVMEIRILEGTYNELTSRQNLLERALVENRAALDALKGLGENPTDEVLTQIGGGAMLKSKPPTAKTVLVSIGSGVVVEKPKSEAISILEGRTRDVEKTLISVINQRNQIAERLEGDRQVLNAVLTSQNQKE